MKKRFLRPDNSTLWAIIVFGLIALASFQTTYAQSDTAADSSHQPAFKIDLGISACGTLFANGNDGSAYYSRFGFTLQVPLMAHWQLASHWQLSAGLRYDFCWEPFFYDVEPRGTGADYDLMGLQASSSAHSNQFAYHSYIGIPVELKWYPRASDKGLLSVGVDFVGAYAVRQYFDLGGGRGEFNAMNPLKLELGLSLGTDRLGLIHGVRLFTNLLPTYIDPVTDEKVRLLGLSLYL